MLLRRLRRRPGAHRERPSSEGRLRLAPHSACTLACMNDNSKIVGFVLGQVAVINILIVVVLTKLIMHGW